MRSCLYAMYDRADQYTLARNPRFQLISELICCVNGWILKKLDGEKDCVLETPPLYPTTRQYTQTSQPNTLRCLIP